MRRLDLTGQRASRGPFLLVPGSDLGAEFYRSLGGRLAEAGFVVRLLTLPVLGSWPELLETLSIFARQCPYVAFDASGRVGSVAKWVVPIGEVVKRVQRNIEQLRNDGFHLFGPGEGWQSCRERGVGRMAEPAEIAAAIRTLLEKGK